MIIMYSSPEIHSFPWSIIFIQYKLVLKFTDSPK